MERSNNLALLAGTTAVVVGSFWLLQRKNKVKKIRITNPKTSTKRKHCANSYNNNKCNYKTCNSWCYNNNGFSSVEILPDGKFIFAGGQFNGADYDGILARYNADGTLDTTFAGGAGSGVSEYLASRGIVQNVLHLGLPDRYIEQGKRDYLLASIGLDAEGILQAIEDRKNQNTNQPSVAIHT